MSATENLLTIESIEERAESAKEIKYSATHVFTMLDDIKEWIDAVDINPDIHEEVIELLNNINYLADTLHSDAVDLAEIIESIEPHQD